MININPKDIQLVKDWMNCTDRSKVFPINKELLERNIKQSCTDSYSSWDTDKGKIILKYLKSQNIFPKFCNNDKEIINYDFYKILEDNHNIKL
jgi:hypothetical protein